MGAQTQQPVSVSARVCVRVCQAGLGWAGAACLSVCLSLLLVRAGYFLPCTTFFPWTDNVWFHYRFCFP